MLHAIEDVFKFEVRMTPKQKKQFNEMLYALRTISKKYMTPAQIERQCKNAFGLGYEESMAMSYDNIQATAKNAAKRVREIK